MKKLQEIIHIIFEKYGVIKFIGSIVILISFLSIFQSTGNLVWKWLAIPFVVYAVLTMVLMLAYAWIINPINDLIQRRKKKSGE